MYSVSEQVPTCLFTLSAASFVCTKQVEVMKGWVYIYDVMIVALRCCETEGGHRRKQVVNNGILLNVTQLREHSSGSVEGSFSMFRPSKKLFSRGELNLL